MDVSEGVRDVVTLRGRDDKDGDEEAEARKKKPVRLTDVAPLGGRLVLFKSDARVPHEVLAAAKPRFAVTLWYFHGEEVAAARRGAPATAEEREAQEAKIKREIESMTLKYGGGANAPPEVRTRASRDGEWSVHAKKTEGGGEGKKKRRPEGSLPRKPSPRRAAVRGLVGSRRRDRKRIRPDAGGARAASRRRARVGVLGGGGTLDFGSRRRDPRAAGAGLSRRGPRGAPAGRGHRSRRGDAGQETDARAGGSRRDDARVASSGSGFGAERVSRVSRVSAFGGSGFDAGRSG
jgi:hypothetical protein